MLEYKLAAYFSLHITVMGPALDRRQEGASKRRKRLAYYGSPQLLTLALSIGRHSSQSLRKITRSNVRVLSLGSSSVSLVKMHLEAP